MIRLWLALLFLSFVGCKLQSTQTTELKAIEVLGNDYAHLFFLDGPPNSQGIVYWQKCGNIQNKSCIDIVEESTLPYLQFKENIQNVIVAEVGLGNFSRANAIILGAIIATDEHGAVVCAPATDAIICGHKDLMSYNREFDWLLAAFGGTSSSTPAQPAPQDPSGPETPATREPVEPESPPTNPPVGPETPVATTPVQPDGSITSNNGSTNSNANTTNNTQPTPPSRIGETYEGYGTDFEAFGQPYGGCGVPEDLLFDDNGNKLPYVALNVQNTNIAHEVLPRPIQQQTKIGMWDNGKNCGRWVEITVGNDCKGAQMAHEGRICVNQDGTHGPENYNVSDELNGKKIYGIIADSCQDPNYWCRDNVGHIDISTHEINDKLQEWGATRAQWNNREVTWNFISGPPPEYTFEGVKFAWAENASRYWPALIVYNLENGLARVDVGTTENRLVPARMNSDMGQMWVLDNNPEVEETANGGAMFKIRAYDKDRNIIGDYLLTLPKKCMDGCKKVTKVKPHPVP